MLPAQRVRSHLLSPLALATLEEDQAERRRGQISGWLLAHLLTRFSSNPPSSPPFSEQGRPLGASPLHVYLLLLIRSLTFTLVRFLICPCRLPWVCLGS